VRAVASLMPIIGTWFLVCFSPNLTADSVMKLDWGPQSRSARQVWRFPLQSVTLICAVTNNTNVTDDSLKVWYVACRFSCCCDKPWSPLLCSLVRSLFLRINVWCHFPQILQPWHWQSFIVCLLLKQLMHNLLFLTTLYLSSSDNCWTLWVPQCLSRV